MEEKYVAREIIEKYRLLAEELEASASEKKFAGGKYDNAKGVGLLSTVVAIGVGLAIYPILGVGTGGGVGYIAYREVKKRREKYEKANKEFNELNKRVNKLAKEIGLKK